MASLASVLLIAAAGFFFMLANLVMKLMGDMPFYVLYPAIAAAFVAGAFFEVEALRDAQLGYAITFILACELLFSILIAFFFLKESYSLGNLAGIGLVIIGISLLHVPATRPQPEAQPEVAAMDREP